MTYPGFLTFSEYSLLKLYPIRHTLPVLETEITSELKVS